MEKEKNKVFYLIHLDERERDKGRGTLHSRAKKSLNLSDFVSSMKNFTFFHLFWKNTHFSNFCVDGIIFAQPFFLVFLVEEEGKLHLFILNTNNGILPNFFFFSFLASSSFFQIKIE